MPEREPTDRERMQRKLLGVELSLNELDIQLSNATLDQATTLLPIRNNLLIKQRVLQQWLSTSTAGRDVMDWNIQILN